MRDIQSGDLYKIANLPADCLFDFNEKANVGDSLVLMVDSNQVEMGVSECGFYVFVVKGGNIFFPLMKFDNKTDMVDLFLLNKRKSMVKRP